MQNLEIKKAISEEEIKGALFVRKKVFVDEQGIDINIERDNHDWKDATHVVAVIDGNFVGTARFISTKDGAKIQRMAVLPEYRNNGLGGKILEKLLELIKEQGFKRVYFSAQETAENFYKKFGFSSYGDVFEEVGLPHIMMEKFF